MSSLLLQRSNLSCKLTNHCNSCSRALFKSQTKEGPSEMRNCNMFFYCLSVSCTFSVKMNSKSSNTCNLKLKATVNNGRYICFSVGNRTCFTYLQLECRCSPQPQLATQPEARKKISETNKTVCFLRASAANLTPVDSSRTPRSGTMAKHSKTSDVEAPAPQAS